MSELASTGAVITSLAVLKANWDYQGQAYTDCFLPFVEDVLRSAERHPVALADIQAAVETSFGIRIPQAALKSILQRAVRRGVVTRKDHEYFPHADKLATCDLGPARRQVLRKHEALVDKLVEFCHARFTRDLSREDADRALLAHIESRTVPLLRTVVKALPVERDPAKFTPDQLEYVVGAFVVDVAQRDPAGFEYLEAVVKGSMLASALYLPDLGTADQKFTDLTLYFDTPFLLDALGHNGAPSEDSANELLELVYRLGARLACFEDTVTEIRGVLVAVASSLRDPRRSASHAGGVRDFFVTNGFRPSDIEVLANRVEQDLAARRIAVVEAPAHSQSLGVDEVVLRELLTHDVRYTRDEALQHDLDALTAVYRLRAGTRFARLEHARALFVTTNDPLVDVGRRFFGTRQLDAAVPVAMLDHELGTLAWLKKPMAAPCLPRKQIIADSLAALQPSPEMWRRYMGEIDRLEARGDVSADDIVLLRHSCEAHQRMMEGTLGDPSGLSSRTVTDALEAAREAAAVRAVEKGLVVARQEVRGELDEVRAASSDAAKRAEEATAELAHVRLLLRRQARESATRVARRASRSAFLCLSFAGLLALASTACPADWLPAWATKAWMRFVFGMLGLALSVVGWTHGTSAHSLARALELWLADRLDGFYLRRIPRAVLSGDPPGVPSTDAPAQPDKTAVPAAEPGALERRVPGETR